MTFQLMYILVGLTEALETGGQISGVYRRHVLSV
jgi:hypothetical protein